MTNSITLKWGTLKAWSLETEEALDKLHEYAAYGMKMSALYQKDTPTQQKRLLELIEMCDEIWLDWNGKIVSKEDAANYVLNYQR